MTKKKVVTAVFVLGFILIYVGITAFVLSRRPKDLDNKFSGFKMQFEKVIDEEKIGEKKKVKFLGQKITVTYAYSKVYTQKKNVKSEKSVEEFWVDKNGVEFKLSDSTIIGVSDCRKYYEPEIKHRGFMSEDEATDFAYEFFCEFRGAKDRLDNWYKCMSGKNEKGNVVITFAKAVSSDKGKINKLMNITMSKNWKIIGFEIFNIENFDIFEGNDIYERTLENCVKKTAYDEEHFPQPASSYYWEFVPYDEKPYVRQTRLVVLVYGRYEHNGRVWKRSIGLSDVAIYEEIPKKDFETIFEKLMQE